MATINWLPGARPLLFVGVAVLVAALALLVRAWWKGGVLPGGPNASSDSSFAHPNPAIGSKGRG
jgi:hypothetical protein